MEVSKLMMEKFRLFFSLVKYYFIWRHRKSIFIERCEKETERIRVSRRHTIQGSREGKVMVKSLVF